MKEPIFSSPLPQISELWPLFKSTPLNVFQYYQEGVWTTNANNALTALKFYKDRRKRFPSTSLDEATVFQDWEILLLIKVGHSSLTEEFPNAKERIKHLASILTIDLI